MSKFDSLNDTFNTDDSVEVDAIVKAEDAEIQKSQTRAENVEKDYDYTRGNLYSLIEKGQEAINGIMEVAGQLIKSVADTTDKLADLHKKVKDIEADNPKTQNTVTNNALFVGSTSELSKMLKDGLLNNNSSE